MGTKPHFPATPIEKSLILALIKATADRHNLRKQIKKWAQTTLEVHTKAQKAAIACAETQELLKCLG